MQVRTGSGANGNSDLWALRPATVRNLAGICTDNCNVPQTATDSSSIDRNHNHEMKEDLCSRAPRPEPAVVWVSICATCMSALLAKGMKPEMARLTFGAEEKDRGHCFTLWMTDVSTQND